MKQFIVCSIFFQLFSEFCFKEHTKVQFLSTTEFGFEYATWNSILKVVFCEYSAYILDRLSYIWIEGTQLPFWSKFHGESTDLLYIFKIFPTHYYIKELQWHISLEIWFIYFIMSAAVSWAVQARQCSHHAACKCKQITEKGFFSLKN